MPKKVKAVGGMDITPEKVGAWAFIIGVAIAIIAGLFGTSLGMINPATGALEKNAVLVLGLLGVIVGILNVTDREVGLFLIAAIALLVAAGGVSVLLSEIPSFGVLLQQVLKCAIVFVAPGAAIVAIKALWDISRARYA